MSYEDYYKEAYSLSITNLNQPLLKVLDNVEKRIEGRKMKAR